CQRSAGLAAGSPRPAALHSSTNMPTIRRALTLLLAAALATLAGSDLAGRQIAPARSAALPSTPMRFGAFLARFAPDGTFRLEGQGWPPFNGSWKVDGAGIELITPGAPQGCDKPG